MNTVKGQLTIFHVLWGSLILVLLLALSPSLYADPPMPSPVGRVIWVKGELKAVMPNKEERLLQKMSVIYLNDTLITNATSQAQIAFTDNSLMTFRENTKFYIDKYEFQPGKKSVGKYIMNLIEGGFRTITGLIAKNNPNNYQVNTPVATIGVRGTDYAIYLNKGELYIGYYQGTPCVNSQKGQLCLNEKQQYAFVPSATSAPIPLTQRPTVFEQKLNITPTKIEPFSVGGINTPRNAGSATRAGTVSTFCITN